MTVQRIYTRIQQDLNTLAELLREQDKDNYLDTPQDKCYNPKPLLNALQKAQNSVEDLKQFVKWVGKTTHLTRHKNCGKIIE